MKSLFLLNIFITFGLPTVYADVSFELGKLSAKDLTTAKNVVKNLELIASDSSNLESRKAQAFGVAVKDVFTAEFICKESIKKSFEDDIRASELDRQSVEHMKPNSLGTINRNTAEQKAILANNLRKNSLNTLINSCVELNLAIRNLQSATEKSDISGENKSVLTELANSISVRTLLVGEKAIADSREKYAQAPDLLAREDAERVKTEAVQDSQKRQEAALRAMQRAIRSGSRNDEARALKLLMADAPDAVKEFNSYLASKAAQRKDDEFSDMERKIDEIDRRTR